MLRRKGHFVPSASGTDPSPRDRVLKGSNWQGVTLLAYAVRRHFRESLPVGSSLPISSTFKAEKQDATAVDLRKAPDATINVPCRSGSPAPCNHLFNLVLAVFLRGAAQKLEPFSRWRRGRRWVVSRRATASFRLVSEQFAGHCRKQLLHYQIGVRSFMGKGAESLMRFFSRTGDQPR